MKKLFAILMLSVCAMTAHAEASFDQVQSLIQQQNYAAAAAGLEGIIQNHPKSAKAFYAMAQAQAGLGNLEKARKALDIATGLNPTLDFAPESAVASLRQAVTPQVAKIEAVEESHWFRNLLFTAMFILFGTAVYFLYSAYMNQKEEEAKQAERDRIQKAKNDLEKRAASTPATPKPERKEQVERVMATRSYTPSSYTPAASPAPAPTPAPTVVNNHYGSNNDGLLTGILIGDMMSNHHHHDTERTVVRETVREVPARDTSWDTPSRSSSWDDTPSTSRSSSWDSSSSSSSSSSWSSSSDSSSSWDSGSSSSSWD
jgi:tetratricopeptide (TPR) repeat protein